MSAGAAGTGAGPRTAAHDAGRAPVPPFTAAHERLRGRMREWIARELTPHVPAWEAAGSFDDEAIRACARAGWVGLAFGPEHGGAGDPVAAAVLAEELARTGSGGLGAGIGAHACIALPPIWRFGTREQHARWLVPGLRGERIAALAITEPDAGSDVAGLRTRADRVDGGWSLSGEKTFITNGVRADTLVVAARTRPEGGHAGISFLIVDAREPDGTRRAGVSAAPLRKLGWHASDTATIAFDDVFVGDEALLGELHGGFKLIMVNFAWERLMMAFGALGAMELAHERAVELATARRGGQAIRHRLAEVATAHAVGRALTCHALRLHLAGDPGAVQAVTMAKLATQRAAYDAADACLQTAFDLGAFGDPLLERTVRDLRLGPIGGGTDEVMREILGRVMGL